MDSDKIILILPDSFRPHSIPMLNGVQEEVFRAWSEYGFLSEAQWIHYRDRVEVKFASEMVDAQP